MGLIDGDVESYECAHFYKKINWILFISSEKEKKTANVEN